MIPKTIMIDKWTFSKTLERFLVTLMRFDIVEEKSDICFWPSFNALVDRQFKVMENKYIKTLLIDDMRDIKADIIARTYEEGIKALKEDGPFSVLYLDHDLASYDENGNEKTGYHVMCFLEEFPEYLPEKIICVSSNPAGMKRIHSVIEKLYGE